MQLDFKTAALRNLNNNKYFLEILLQSCLCLGKEGWSWAECYMLPELICLFICFWLIAHLKLFEKWQSVNILPLMGHVTDSQHSRLKRSIWVLQTLLTARFIDGWQSSIVLTKMLLTLPPNMLGGLQFTAVHTRHNIQNPNMFLGEKRLIFTYGKWFRSMKSLKKNAVLEVLLWSTERADLFLKS